MQPCSSPVADFQPAASATAKNPALTSWAKECRAVGPGTARFGQSFGKLPFKLLSEQAFGAQAALQSSLFLPTQNVEEPDFATSRATPAAVNQTRPAKPRIGFPATGFPVCR